MLPTVDEVLNHRLEELDQEEQNINREKPCLLRSMNHHSIGWHAATLSVNVLYIVSRGGGQRSLYEIGD